MRRILFYGLPLLSVVLIAVLFIGDPPKQTKGKVTKEQRIKEALEDEIQRTMDPALGYVPKGALQQARIETIERQREFALSGNRNTFTESVWRERGPNNIGGRTRSIMIDLSDPDRKTIFAGSVSGGIWKTEDITENPVQWEKVNDYMENLSIGALAQDPNNHSIMYAGTGEIATEGIGIFRSVDGGDSWQLLPSTEGVGAFELTRALMVHPETSDVYLGTNSGVWRSQDQGDSWDKVAGYISGVDVTTSEIYDIEYASNGYIYYSGRNNVRRSMTGDLGDWETLTSNGFPTGLSRVEMSISWTNPNKIYIIGSVGGGASPIYASSDGGQSWTQRALPTINGGQEFTRGQAWYDLEIAVDPFNENQIVVGGVPTFRSVDGGVTLIEASPLWPGDNEMHVDQHEQVFDKDNQGVVYFGNDGGVWRSVSGPTAIGIQNKNYGYNVTQFYACAFHPGVHEDYILGGTQDNNSLQIAGPGIAPARAVRSGDGFFCHIDQNEPNIQMVSSQFAAYGLSTDGGQSFGGGADFNGAFRSFSDYDSENNIMYSQTYDGDFYRWHVNTGETTLVNLVGANINPSCIMVDPNTPERVYFGASGGLLYKVENATEGTAVDAIDVSPPGGGTVSSLDIELGNPDHLLLTKSNYNINSVFESFDGGESWSIAEGDLPDMPVRWGVFNPKDATQALIATETGVWVTELLDGANTTWIPPTPGKGTPLVRTDMLQVRRSDNIILAATYGRGMFTTDVFADPVARMQNDQVGYLNSTVSFDGTPAINASSYHWDLGDGTEETQESFEHAYDEIGVYPVVFKINDDDNLTVNSQVKILPDRALPYSPDGEEYSGDFEGYTEQYGVNTVRGSSFERGNSIMQGKNGTHSGDNAFVVGMNEEYYQQGTLTMLYLPNYDFSEPGIYDFSFWAKYRLSSGFDGFQVQYSLNRGQSWKQLGSADDDNWYTYESSNIDGAPFVAGQSYFSGNKYDWDHFNLNISHLAGESDVAFRIVFQGVKGDGNFRGLAIDDIQITKYEGQLQTTLLGFAGEYETPTQARLYWSTQPEYFCKKFDVERSFNGKDFEVIETVAAEGDVSALLHEYEISTLAQNKLIFYRLKVINENVATDYSYEFYSPTIVMRRKIEGSDPNKVFPNPFTDEVNINFTNIINDDFNYKLVDQLGRVVAEGSQELENAVITTLQFPELPQGIYYLEVQIGKNGEYFTYKLLRE